MLKKELCPLYFAINKIIILIIISCRDTRVQSKILNFRMLAKTFSFCSRETEFLIPQTQRVYGFHRIHIYQ